MNFGTNIVNTTIIKYSLRPLISLDRTVHDLEVFLVYLCRHETLLWRMFGLNNRTESAVLQPVHIRPYPQGRVPFPIFMGRGRLHAGYSFAASYSTRCFLSGSSASTSSLLTVIRGNGQHLSKFTTYNIPCRKFSTLSAFVFSLVLMFR